MLPLPRPGEENAKRGDSEGDTRGDTAKADPGEVSPSGASAWPQKSPEDAIEGDTVNSGQVQAASPSEEGDLQDQKAEAI